MTARDSMEAACHAAVTRLRQDIQNGVYRPVADAALVDAVLKAADRYALGAAAARRREQVTARALDEALAKVRDASPADVLRAERTDIGRQPTYGTKAKVKAS